MSYNSINKLATYDSQNYEAQAYYSDSYWVDFQAWSHVWLDARLNEMHGTGGYCTMEKFNRKFSTNRIQFVKIISIKSSAICQNFNHQYFAAIQFVKICAVKFLHCMVMYRYTDALSFHTDETATIIWLGLLLLMAIIPGIVLRVVAAGVWNCSQTSFIVWLNCGMV